MTTYRKKPVIVEAFKWTGGPDQVEDPEWIVEAMQDGRAWVATPPGGLYPCMYLYRHTGTTYAESGDYIIKEPGGQLNTLKPNEFLALYELDNG